MNPNNPGAAGYAIDIQPLEHPVTIWHGRTRLAESHRARVMYETRLPPAIYVPAEDILVDLGEPTGLRSFCPFKGTASYFDISLGDTRLENAVWQYRHALPEAHAVRDHVGFMPHALTRVDLGDNRLRDDNAGHLGGPLIDWLLREAPTLPTPEAFTAALAGKLRDHGVAVSRLSVMIWSLHPQFVGKNYTWTHGDPEITTLAPSYEMHAHPAFLNSPLRHVSNGLGGVRQKIGTDYSENSFPIIEDLRRKGATDYVAMPLTFSDGRRNVLTLTSDHPDGFTTANLGLVFECSPVISRYYEVFMQKENARALLETYVGKRSGARVLGGEIRRGDGDEIDAAIMFCDLRGSTRLEESLDREDYLALLNDFFDTVTDQVQEAGGEVLKFIGDAVLAVFPACDDPDDAKARALEAAREIVIRVAELRAEGGASCDCAVGLAYGRVTFGNVGSRERLDFTVIGRAANIAARLGDFGKAAGHRIVATAEIAGSAAGCLALGPLDLHNVSQPVEGFAVPAEPSSGRGAGSRHAVTEISPPEPAG